MINSKKVLGIVTARGGSKGLPNKNIKNIAGKPLIRWTIEAGLKSEYLDKVLVTTDSEDIADVARASGGDVPFLRPKELALDTTPSVDAITHALDWALKNYGDFEYIILLEPTSPLRTSVDIDAAIGLLENNSDANSVVGVCKVESAHPDFLCKLDGPYLRPFQDSFEAKRRQDIKDYYYFEGSVYVSRVAYFKEKKTFYHDTTLPYIVPKWKSFEIDDIIDFIIIEKLLELQQQDSKFLK